MIKKLTLVPVLLLVTVFAKAQVGVGTTTPYNALDVESNSTTKTATDINNTSTGDAVLQLQLNGTTKFSMGIDNSDADKFKISTDSTFNVIPPALSIDASQKVGLGTASPNSTLDIQGSLGYKVTTLTAATTLNHTYNVILCNNGPYTITLPPASTSTGRVYKFKNIDETSDPFIIAGNGSEVIDDGAQWEVYPYRNTITLLCDGTQWLVMESYIDVTVPTIYSLNCFAAIHSGVLAVNQIASGVTSEIPYIGGNGGLFNGQTVSSTGVTGLTATLIDDNFVTGDGSLTYTITGTPTSVGTASFAINVAGRACTLTRTVVNLGTITALNCGSATNNGTLNAGSAATGVSSVIPYTGGNGGFHNGQTVNSTGVTGLTATLSAGVFANGSGNLTYTITGTPNTYGTASFALNIGGRTCTLTRTVNCMTAATAIVDVTNPTTGKTWMDRNLGASRVATSSTDSESYGDSYQWGRLKDGHECRNSPTTTTLSTTDVPWHGNFITTSNSPFDWRTTQNDLLWQGVNGINNPCPSGYRLPTSAELNNERLSWGSQNGAGALASPLKLPMTGSRLINGSLFDVGLDGAYWSSTVSGANASYLAFNSGSAGIYSPQRARGNNIRCIKD